MATTPRAWPGLVAVVTTLRLGATGGGSDKMTSQADVARRAVTPDWVRETEHTAWGPRIWF